MFNEGGEYRPFQLIEKIRVRFKELFGIFQLQSATLKLYDSELGNIMIVGCKLAYIDYFLVSVILCEPSLTTVFISGTLKRLRRNVSKTDFRNIKNNES